MVAAKAEVAGFLGTWILDPTSCNYEQGTPPVQGTYRIFWLEEEVRFQILWTDADGARHEVEFGGPPSGVHVPFGGGELADTLSVNAVSARELRSSAFKNGEELMVAQRQLDDSGRAMRVVQMVRFPGGQSLVNTSVYRKQS